MYEIHFNSNVNLQHQQIMHCVYKTPKCHQNIKKTSTSLQLACLHLNINIYQRLIAVCFVLIHLHLTSICFGTGWCQNNVETIEECRWGLTFVAQSSFCQVDQAVFFFLILEKSCILWNCCSGCRHAPPRGLLCAGGGHQVLKSFTLPHSLRSLQGVLGFAFCTPFFAAGRKFMNFHRFCGWIVSVLGDIWSNHDCGGYGLVSPSFICPKCLFLTFLLASYLCTVWLADPNALCVLEPDSKKIGLLQHKGTYRRTSEGFVRNKERWKTGGGGELEAWAQC